MAQLDYSTTPVDELYVPNPDGHPIQDDRQWQRMIVTAPELKVRLDIEKRHDPTARIASQNSLKDEPHGCTGA